MGRGNEKRSKRLLIIGVLFFILLVGLLLWPWVFGTGKAVLNIQNINTTGQVLEGTVSLSLQKN